MNKIENSIKNKLSKYNLVISLENRDELNTQEAVTNDDFTQQKKNQQIVDLNTKLSNTIYSSVQLLADKIYVDWDRVRKYAYDELKYLDETSNKINEIGKNYYQMISNFDDIKAHGNELPDINTDYCREYLKK